ncbi:hypothetical protein C8R47DRAFT_213834 [Mycena vitilis]|nr:hypothetical protein C8R47DRAFT_213834 [Mycena vitilis]
MRGHTVAYSSFALCAPPISTHRRPPPHGDLIDAGVAEDSCGLGPQTADYTDTSCVPSSFSIARDSWIDRERHAPGRDRFGARHDPVCIVCVRIGRWPIHLRPPFASNAARGAMDRSIATTVSLTLCVCACTRTRYGVIASARVDVEGQEGARRAGRRRGRGGSVMEGVVWVRGKEGRNQTRTAAQAAEGPGNELVARFYMFREARELSPLSAVHQGGKYVDTDAHAPPTHPAAHGLVARPPSYSTPHPSAPIPKDLAHTTVDVLICCIGGRGAMGGSGDLLQPADDAEKLECCRLRGIDRIDANATARKREAFWSLPRPLAVMQGAGWELGQGGERFTSFSGKDVWYRSEARHSGVCRTTLQ